MTLKTSSMPFAPNLRRYRTYQRDGRTPGTLC